ncbi:amino acid ABC transporter ATP-binding protein [Gluconacetobacter azotocaptans]|uniref:Amino acid ABC transporter ATP-binding protein n=1 Tax=Gluconacetobacter azotocaptans TaxID=142834 RepID=A0A7W4PFL1_9PROT|nr:amino acid ABC transporter ATP-binding protein [Gluconacetobacter azotocaptans]MBB2189031.1 amino acid ABC transporter ATP-binding protein [Gluconacetobacter azotocaptans]GBQ26939.1 amino acid transporter ATP-binding protein [Gluconacetobacter azotocaptans DSM 13594]
MSGAAPQPVLVARGLRKSYGAIEVLAGVDLAVAPGEVACLIGPSGGGKSTLLRCLNFLERPSGGSISVFGEALCQDDGTGVRIAPERTLRRARSRMPMVFQHFNLFNHQTVLQNVMEGPVTVLGLDREAATDRARRLLRDVGMAAREDHYPDQISGGQKQRVAIARALAMAPSVILFDEPTSALDPQLVKGILAVINDLAQQGTTMLIVTHEMKFAREVADRVHFCDGGRIVESGRPDAIFQRPRSARLVDFVRSIHE